MPHPNNTFQINGLLAGKEYGVRIRTNCTLCALNSGERSDFSQPITFVTIAAKQHLLSQEMLVKVYPNPNNGIFSIDWTLLDTDRIHAEISNLNGQILWDKTLQSDRIQDIDLSDVLLPGLYLLKLKTTDGLDITTKVMIR